MPTCCSAPRSISSMNGSPAICSEKRVQRAQSTQRSRSSSTWAEMLIGLGKVRLTPVEAGLAAAVGHRLVLQRALAALVADRAVERVVDQQELHDALLRLVGDRRGDLGVDDHALGDRQRAGGLRLREAAAVAGVGDVDQALAAGADRVRAAGGRRTAGSATPICSAARITRVPLGTLTSTPSMVRRDQVGLLRRSSLSWSVMRCAPAAAKRVEAAGSNGQPPWVEVREVLVAEVLDRAR